MLRTVSNRLLILSLLAIISVVSIGIVLAHGSMDDPISRIYACYLEGPESPDTVVCSDVIASGGTQQLYDWNEINISNAAGNHQAIIPDGELCSAGREKYAAFDEPRTDWARTILPDSGMYTFLYEAYVPHNQGYFELWVTKDGYDPTQPLGWDDIEMFALVDEPLVVDGDYYMPVQLPEGKSGHHVIYAIWQRNDSPEAFYSCSDVWFGDSPTPTPTTAPACTAPAWNSTITYSAGDVVSYNNAQWVARWGTAGTEPATVGASEPWRLQSYCTSGGPTPLPTSTSSAPTATAVPNETPTSAPPTATSVPPTGTCVVDYDIVNQWGNGFQANVAVHNNTNAAIAGWTLNWTHVSGQGITSAWNADVLQTGNDVSASNPASHWNGTITANGSISFGFQGSLTGISNPVVPTDFVLNGVACNEGDPQPTATTLPPTTTSIPPTATTQPPTTTAVPPTPTSAPPTATAVPPTATPSSSTTCAVAYDIVNQWNDGFQVNITITNLDNTAVQGYTLAWNFSNGQQYGSGWNATFNQSGTGMTASNVASYWNGMIGINGGSVSFGFVGSHSGTVSVPTNFTLNGSSCDS